jgi:hypothetical protein
MKPCKRESVIEARVAQAFQPVSGRKARPYRLKACATPELAQVTSPMMRCYLEPLNCFLFVHDGNDNDICAGYIIEDTYLSETEPELRAS